MKIAMATLSIVVTLVGSITLASLPEGRFLGKGLWKSEQSSGRYEVETVITSNSVRSNYVTSSGDKKEWNFELVFSTKEFFKVVAYGAEVGKGYCLENVQLCHYEVTAGNLKLEETITSQNGKLYRFGSKDVGKGPMVWQESEDLVTKFVKERL